MNKIIDIFARAYQKKLTLIVIQTLRILFPLILLGSFAEVIKLPFFMRFSRKSRDFSHGMDRPYQAS